MYTSKNSTPVYTGSKTPVYTGRYTPSPAEVLAARYELGDTNTPSNSELKSWGITRDQYKALYSKALSDFDMLGIKFKGDKTNEVNAYLKERMVATGGKYANYNNTSNKEYTPVTATPTSTTTTKSSGGTSAPVIQTAAPVASTVEAPPIPTYLTADEIAQKIGLERDYATILKQMQDVTSKSFDESNAVLARAEGANLRGQESSYNQYLQDLRSRSANAVASGATKGTMAANSLASLLGFQEANKESSNLMNDQVIQTALERKTAMALDETTARTRADAAAQYLGTLSSNMDANYINKYAAELSDQASRYVADAQAKATTNAASIGANASLGAARIGASAPTQYDQIIAAFTNDYLAKGYAPIEARRNADMDYASSLRNVYPTVTK